MAGSCLGCIIEKRRRHRRRGGRRGLTNRTATLSAVRCSTGKGDSHHIVITDATSHLKCDASKSRYHHMPTDNFTRSTTSNHMLHTLVSFMPATWHNPPPRFFAYLSRFVASKLLQGRYYVGARKRAPLLCLAGFTLVKNSPWNFTFERERCRPASNPGKLSCLRQFFQVAF